MYDFKKIDIGELIRKRVVECDIDVSRICKIFECDESDLKKMYNSKDINTDILLKWSKLLKYDFFRIYTQHLILFSPELKNSNPKSLPSFRKNIYTEDIIYFILNLIKTGNKTKEEVMDDYRIPKTTLYNWIRKYGN